MNMNIKTRLYETEKSERKHNAILSPLKGVGLLLFAAIAYALVFDLVYPVVGIIIVLFEFIIIAIGGWFFGISVGVFAGLLFSLTGTLLFYHFGETFTWQEYASIWFFEIGIGAITGWLGSLQRKLKNQKKEAEAALRLKDFAVDSSINAITISNLDGNLIYVNRSFLRMWGYKEEKEVLTKPVIEFWNDTAQAGVMIDILREKGDWIGDLIGRKKDGTLFDVQLSAHLVKNDKGIPISMMTSFLDISDRKRAEEALRKSEEKLTRSMKMESMGLLAGGVAHDLNNVLSGIVSYPELILMELPEDNKLRKPIKAIQESGHRAVAIVQDLLTVARGVATTKETLNLNDLIRDYLLSPEFKKLEQFHPTVTVKTNFDTDLLNINGSNVHIRKIVMNLVSNAYEAIEGGGNAIISTMNRYLDRPLRGYEDASIGEYAIIAVSDDGSGISSGDLERIFEPFYTRKVMGRSGTGLGLAVVWNVVQDHKGYIDVISDKNGTTFELYFPITRDAIPGKALTIPIEDFKGEGETILVVDDVKSQRDISCKMLDTLDYKTRAVSSGEEAVEYLKEHSVDLILLDMIMDPGINGRETYERIIGIHPDQKTVLISGFSESDEVKAAQKLGAGQYVKKPIALEKIGLAVKGELEK